MEHLLVGGGKQVDIPSGKFLQVSLGDEHGCGIREDNTMSCWGTNDYDQTVPPEGIFSQVSEGSGFTCAIRTDDTMTCWGRNKEKPQYPIITPNGQLMLGFPNEKNLNLWALDRQTCDMIRQEEIPTEYKEVKGLAQPDYQNFRSNLYFKESSHV